MMVVVNESMRQGYPIAIAAWLGIFVLASFPAWRMPGWDTILYVIIIGVLANGLWGAFQLQDLKRENGDH
jgi:hypothetical protein